MWLGYRVNKTCYFKLSSDYPKWDEKFTAKMNDGNHYGKVPAISTFTNIYPDLYPKYDNYNAIEVSKVLQIPLDYDGAMGVPITFLDVYNPDQFEILGITDRQNTSGLRTKKYTQNDSIKYNDLNVGCVYARILIKNKHPEDYQNDYYKA